MLMPAHRWKDRFQVLLTEGDVSVGGSTSNRHPAGSTGISLLKPAACGRTVSKGWCGIRGRLQGICRNQGQEGSRKGPASMWAAPPTH